LAQPRRSEEPVHHDQEVGYCVDLNISFVSREMLTSANDASTQISIDLERMSLLIVGSWSP
jgi:hypothetical protein